MPVAHDPRFPYRSELEMPVIGLESEFKVFVDEEEVTPEELWRTPAAFIDRPLLKRTTKSSQLPTGGAVYFDGGVIELVTPVIEIAPHCTARVVRSLWEQIGFVRDHLDRWEKREGRRVRLQAFSCHVNISFELERAQRTRNRTVQKLALLLAHLLPVPVIVTGANRKSSGVGVRPRRERIEITTDFTPDPGLMAATVALIVGIVRDVIGWESYRVDEIDARGVPRIARLEPGKHATRKGWLARAAQFPRDPFKSNIDVSNWKTADGRTVSLRQLALEMATHFRDSIRQYSDPFSYRLLFSLLRGDTPALLDLRDRPPAYDDVGRSTRWGTVLPELENFRPLMLDSSASSDEPRRRGSDLDEKLSPPWSGDNRDRRHLPATARPDRRSQSDRRSTTSAPSKRLTRSAYERVFLNLASGKRLRIGNEMLTPVAVKGWYHSIFRTPGGEERMLSIDQLLDYQGAWTE